jgi:hypothetical protein
MFGGFPKVIAGYDISYAPLSVKPFVGFEDQDAFGAIPIYDLRYIAGVTQTYRLDSDGTTVSPSLP